MQQRTMWVWIVTGVNVALAMFLVLGIYEFLRAAAIAAAVAVADWYYAVFLLGITLSIVALRLTKGIGSKTWRWLGYIVNSCSLLPYALVIAGIAAMVLNTTEERFVIPNGYQGYIYVFYGAADGTPQEKTFRRVTYRIPATGILVTQAPSVHGWFKSSYYYELPNRTLQPIPDVTRSTAEDKVDDKDVAVYFAGGAAATLHAIGEPCPVEYSSFYVGTEAYLLSMKAKELDLKQYLHDHPGSCNASSASAK